MQIVVTSVQSGSGHIIEICKYLERYGNVTAVWGITSPYGFDWIYKKSKFGFKNLPKKGDVLIMAGVSTIKKLINNPNINLEEYLAGYKRKIIVVTDGGIMREQKYWNEYFRRMDIEVFVTGCKTQFIDGPYKVYYQPFDLSFAKIVKHPKLTVSHSPYGKKKFREKGTNRIIEVCANQKVRFDLVTGIKWEEAIKRKAQSHIFIDQIDHFDGANFGWAGGIGKSGLEAMLLRNVVISAGNYNTTDDIPVPPIVWCDKRNFANKLNRLINKPKLRNKIVERQMEWAKKYLDPAYTAERIIKS